MDNLAVTTKKPVGKKLRLWLGRGLLLLVFLVAILAGGIWWQLRASLPQLDGQARVTGLSGRVIVERDALGAPTIRAANRVDAARALGFLHAQDRFFQMDLMRRVASGELAELFGEAALKQDQAARLHRFRARAERVREMSPSATRALMEAYADGVNTGLRSLGASPPEYLLLRAHPQPWRPEDSCLVAYAMFMSVQDATGRDDLHEALLHQVLPPAAVEFFGWHARSWEAPLDGSQLPQARLPAPGEFSYASLGPANNAASGKASARLSNPGQLLAAGGAAANEDEEMPGSNNWAVDGKVSGTGAAIVCNDMHLGLTVPNTWYRARMIYQDAELGEQDLAGMTLPGAWMMVLGSNRHIAWSFSNPYVDMTDLVRLEIDPANPRRYRTPDGWREFERYEQAIRVRGGADANFAVEETIWGPVVPAPGLEGQYALAWVGHFPEALVSNLSEMERVRDVPTALRVAPSMGCPVSNFIIGDREGNIGYTLIGALPQRFGLDGGVPASWADGSRGWRGLLPPESYPRIFNPPGGRLWAANNRILGTPGYLALNPDFQDPGARARQIRDDLQALDHASETNLWSIYHDDRALFLARWQALLLSVLDRGAGTNADWREVRGLVANWGGRAAPESPGYRLVHDFRRRTLDLLFEPVNQRLAGLAPGVSAGNEDAAWVLIKEQPAHLLNPRFASFDALLAGAVDGVLAQLRGEHLTAAEATWGRVNALKMRHPMSLVLPKLAGWLDMPAELMHGDAHMPRVQGPSFGSSERLVISPGHEEQALFDLPGGQSGHFLSPFYRAGHEAWVKAEPIPLLPGPALHTLALVP